ncbi:pyruvate, water dikinase regulatory protein [Microbacterium sp. A196]|uniref:pyruvate, water dikinase regulatory protein n=1 Tax=Microbacterium sp. A196 TaxID=3457320 RepID=UPI003FD2EFAA
MTPPARAVFFVSDGTGITAETLGNALLANFPGFTFVRSTIPFIDSSKAARAVKAEVAGAAEAAAEAPLVFLTVKNPRVRRELGDVQGVVIDLLAGHLTEVEAALGAAATEQLSGYHGVGDAERYFARMRAVEYAIEHDDGQSLRALDQAALVIIAPSRCGKTPTTMYLALQHGLLVANYPLTDDDLPMDALPRAIAPFAARCFGLTTTPQRLSQIRHERRPDSRYASLPQCAIELRRAEDLYRRNRIPFLNSSTKSVEEMSAVILQSLRLRA